VNMREKERKGEKEKTKRGSSAKEVDVTQPVVRIRETRITGTSETPERRKYAPRARDSSARISERADNRGRLLGNSPFWVGGPSSHPVFRRSPRLIRVIQRIWWSRGEAQRLHRDYRFEKPAETNGDIIGPPRCVRAGAGKWIPQLPSNNLASLIANADASVNRL
jgi:hypothetical protein